MIKVEILYICCLCWWQLSAELDRLESVLTQQAPASVAAAGDDHDGDGMFDSISTTFKQFIVQGKDWIGNAKNLVSYLGWPLFLENLEMLGNLTVETWWMWGKKSCHGKQSFAYFKFEAASTSIRLIPIAFSWLLSLFRIFKGFFAY